ncbi:MAG: HNH endonuclease [Oligoflexia bacterium]|nr:HNH endonuclease [Oligoflexia bacterium]
MIAKLSNTELQLKIAKFSNDELLNKTKLLVKEETHKTLEVLHHLREVERRRLYLKISYPSLFEYCVHELKCSHSAAFRRVLDLVNKQSTKLQRKALPAAGSKSDNSENSRAIKHSRYIPAYIKQQIWQRDQGQCQYKDPLSQRQCKSTHFIQIDHITPFSQQGSSLDINNLRLLCGNHNRWRYAHNV